MDQQKDHLEDQQGDERPPIMGSWPGLYGLAIGELVALVVLFYVFTRYFS